MPGFLRGALAPTETKSVDLSPELFAAINGGWGLPTKSKQQVSLTSSLMVTAFYRGMLVIAEDVSQLPIEIYKSLPNGRGVEPAKDHALYDLLRYKPNEWQDAAGFWCSMLMHAVGAGNGVAFRVTVNGETRELLPIRPEHVEIDLDSAMRPTFDLTMERGGMVRVSRDQVFHIQGPSWRGFKGIDPTVVGREAIGLAQATEEAHSRLHANGTRPSGVLTSDKPMDQPQIDLLRKNWHDANAGSAKVGTTPVLANGLKWMQTAMSGVDAEHLNTRKHQIEEIARVLGVFPIMLGHAGDQSPTFASAEAFFAAHVRKSLMPWVVRTRSAIETQLLTVEERREGYHVRIDTSELTRGSLKDRTEYYTAARGTNSSPGWLSPNDIREDDGYNRVDDPRMDQVWQPDTMRPVNEAGNVQADPPVSSDGNTPPLPEPGVKAAADGYAPTDGMVTEAARGLAWREEFGRGGTAVGVARARDIVNRRSLSRETVMRMVSYFARHEVDKQGKGWSPGQDDYPSAGRVAWALWGGDSGRAWANDIADRLDAADE